MKQRHLLAGSCIGLCASVVTPALFAQEARGFADEGKLVVSAERLTGLFLNDASSELDGTVDAGPVQGAFQFESDDSSTTVAFLGSGLEAGPAGVPRLGADYFVIDSLSVGGSLTFASLSESSETQTQVGALAIDNAETEQTTTLFAVSPRVGYGRMFTNVIGLWARGGLTYSKLSSETDITQPGGDGDETEFDASLFSLSADAQLILSPLDHVAFGVGPQLDISLAGDAESSDTQNGTALEGDVSWTTFGFSAGGPGLVLRFRG